MNSAGHSVKHPRIIELNPTGSMTPIDTNYTRTRRSVDKLISKPGLEPGLEPRLELDLERRVELGLELPVPES